jgi:hypothetical protein
MNDALHAGLTAINQATAQLTDGVLIAAKCRALLRGYAARWHDNPYQPFYIERLMLADLINPATQRISRTYRLAGRVDVLATYHDRNILIDHKTTSQDPGPRRFLLAATGCRIAAVTLYAAGASERNQVRRCSLGRGA